MFDLRVPESMAALPGRVHAIYDEYSREYTPRIRIPGGMSHDGRLKQMRDYYYANRDKIMAQRKAKQDQRHTESLELLGSTPRLRDIQIRAST